MGSREVGLENDGLVTIIRNCVNLQEFFFFSWTNRLLHWYLRGALWMKARA